MTLAGQERGKSQVIVVFQAWRRFDEQSNSRHGSVENRGSDLMYNSEPLMTGNSPMASIAFDVPLHQSHMLSDVEVSDFKARIKKLLIDKNAAIVAHYYTDDAIQELAEETGGFVSDSLEMARFGAKCDADTLVVCGVKFMGETARSFHRKKES